MNCCNLAVRSSFFIVHSFALSKLSSYLWVLHSKGVDNLLLAQQGERCLFPTSHRYIYQYFWI